MNMIEMRCSQPEEIPRLKELWKLSFGDEDGYINLFFETQYRSKEVLVLLQDNIIISMLAGLPMQVALPNGREYSAAYIYALCTYPHFRHSGSARDLLSYASSYFKENGKDLLLIKPGATGLYAYFQKQGFSGSFPLKEFVFPGASLNGLIKGGCLTAANPDAYSEEREAFLNGRLHVKCEGSAAAHQKEISKRSGADLYFIEVEDVTGCVAAEYASPGKLVVKELLLPDRLCEAGLRLVAKELPAEEFEVRLPVFSKGLAGGRTEEFFLIQYLLSDLNTHFEPHMPGYPGFAYD